MAVVLQNVVPFGRSAAEYQRMFNLTAQDQQKTILSVADGPASFNADMTQQGWSVISMDPLYALDSADIWQRFMECLDPIIEQVNNTPDDWVWSYHQSPAHLKQNRIQVMQRFLADYAGGKQTGRYQVGSLPHLAYPDQAFDLVLCSHFLFLYSAHFDVNFHLKSIQEMVRVGREVRIFPLLTLDLQLSPHLKPIQQELAISGIPSSLVSVSYELQKGANQMLVLRHT
ncbi:MAG: class I SAM-dependent methyltransferase [Cyanobacteriota bacterium]|nr:class I SAM-dependent methyltransferase [Cyanobacteriota bacterium]